jgi:plastocyanin
MARTALVIVVVLSMLGTINQVVASQSGPTVNVELIVDASGSMAAETDVGTLRIDAAQQVLTDVIAALPDTPGINVGLRIYGHRGNNQDSGRAESCVSSDLMVPLDGVDKTALQGSVDAIVPTGWTPLGYSLEQAQNDFSTPASATVTNAVVLLTDGIETCDGDPAAAAASLLASPSAVMTHVIGFGTTDEDQAALSAIAASGGGQLLGSSNAGQLLDALFSILEDLEVVETSGTGATREDPIAFGRIGRVGEFDISVTDTLINENVKYANNQRAFTAKVSVTYQGNTSARPGEFLDFSAVGDLNSGYSLSTDSCGTLAGLGVLAVNELFTGGSAEFDVCWIVEADDLDSLVMYVDSKQPQDAQRMWFSLDDATTGTSEEATGAVSEPTATAATDVAPLATEVFLDAVDINYQPKELSIPANTDVPLTITNNGILQHSFAIDEASIDVGLIPSGSSVTVTLNLSPGTYVFYCPVPGHKEAGMTGTLIVS